ncbi:dynein axonemal assembly factor 11-like [Diorhabda sublineata]|uniref:dynein axonemal assembly factor 11-like n=1 Tax=Diorhabda sublineata TaxID=1163346 RepID=UPI0024E0FB61|nr:dynein axonemal assembly factor 11-like [Diorhabda sublineata]
MVRITEDLVRKKAEHNECIIGTLEELSLHQEDVEKIEHLNNWCKDLQILYLQANLIPKIENLNKLKKLQYLNLAINNIEKIENLERCESLEKLDLTLNFIGDLESVCTLKPNLHLKELYLTGNPCCDYDGYRNYVVAKLPQLQKLDSIEITTSERIKAQQIIDKTEKRIKEAQNKYFKWRQEQKERMSKIDYSGISNDDFWKMSSENCPETRVEISQRQRNKDRPPTDISENIPKSSVRLFTKDGRPLNVNQAKLDFTFKNDNPKQFVLDIAVYKFLDSNLIDVDLQPIYVKITIKDKVFQIVFPEEVLVERSVAQRSQTTGHLVLNLLKANYKEPECANKEEKIEKTSTKYLEVEGIKDDMDFSKIVERSNRVKDLYSNPEIPPLEYA